MRGSSVTTKMKIDSGPYRAWEVKQGKQLLDVILVPAYLKKQEVLQEARKTFPPGVTLTPKFLQQGKRCQS